MSVIGVRTLFMSQNMMNSAVKALTLRYSSHGHGDVKPFTAVNAPPNDGFPFKVCTLDDLSVPQGDYYEDFRKRNIKYWRHFIQGVAFLSGTIYVMIKYEIAFFNMFVPEMPPKEERIKDFWIPPAYWDDED